MPKELRTCPVCNRLTPISMGVKDGANKENYWYFCRCGSIFSSKGKIDKTIYNEEYKKKWEQGKGLNDRMDYMRSVYMPIISEATMGRKFIEIGHTVDRNIVELNKDGWIATGIDLIKNDYITGDFEKYDFTDRFDVIWLTNVLESFDEPIKVLRKCYNMLYPNGILFIVTPCTELLWESGMNRWGCWNSSEGNIYFSKQMLEYILKMIGFDILVSIENFSQRFTTWNNTHLIAQKLCSTNIGGYRDGEIKYTSVIK